MRLMRHMSPAPVAHLRQNEKRNVESYITHNGDLDFFEFNGTVYALGDVQKILVGLLHAGLPAQVDSMCIAGLLDLLRTKGLWFASVRYGLIFGGLRRAGDLAGAQGSGEVSAMLASARAVGGGGREGGLRIEQGKTRVRGCRTRVGAVPARAPR